MVMAGEDTKKNIPRIQAQMTERIQKIRSAEEIMHLNFGLPEFEKPVVRSGVHAQGNSTLRIGAQRGG